MTSRRTAALAELARAGHENPSTVHVAATSDINSDRLGHKMPATPHRVYEHGEMAADGLKRGGVVGHSPRRRAPAAAKAAAPPMAMAPPPGRMSDNDADDRGGPSDHDADDRMMPSFRRGGRV